MLFQSSVPQIFDKLNLQLYSSANAARKKEAAKHLNFYHDSQLADLEAMLDELFADPSKMVKVQLNLVRKVINNLAQIYCEPPAREIDGNEKDKTIYKNIINTSMLDLKLKQASRYAKLLKSILIKVVWRNEHPDFDILTGNLLDVETGDTPEDLKRVLITDYGNSDKIEDVEYSLWSAESWQRLDYRGNVIESEPNPYHVLPFLSVFDYPPIGNSFWLPGGDDLISQQEAINIKLVDLLHLLHWQSFGVGYIKGSSQEDKGSTLTVGPGSLVELPGNKEAEIGFVSQKAEIQSVVNAIDKMLKWFCITQGLSASAVSTDPSEASGVSKVWDSIELSEMRIEGKLLWGSYEQKLFNLMRIIHNTHSKSKLSDAANLKVNFADPAKPTISPLDEAQSYETYFKMGVMSPVDILMQKDKDLRSREEALGRLKIIKSETQQLVPPDVKQENEND
jgi:hypothetical protein